MCARVWGARWASARSPTRVSPFTAAQSRRSKGNEGNEGIQCIPAPSFTVCLRLHSRLGCRRGVCVRSVSDAWVGGRANRSGAAPARAGLGQTSAVADESTAPGRDKRQRHDDIGWKRIQCTAGTTCYGYTSRLCPVVASCLRPSCSAWQSLIGQPRDERGSQVESWYPCLPPNASHHSTPPDLPLYS